MQKREKELVEKIKELASKGYQAVEIARQLDICKSTVYKYRDKYKLKIQKGKIGPKFTVYTPEMAEYCSTHTAKEIKGKYGEGIMPILYKYNINYVHIPHHNLNVYKILEALRSGESQSNIAKRMGFSRQYVHSVKNRYGL